MPVSLSPTQKAEYAREGGAAGTGLSPQQFLQRWQDFTSRLGMSPVKWASTSGQKLVGALQPGRVTGAFRPGEGVQQFTVGSDPRQFQNVAAIPREAGQLHLINQRAGTDYSSVQEAKDDLGLGFQFAGAAQYAANLAGNTDLVNRNPALQNVSMVGLSDPSAFNLFFGGLAAPLQSGLRSNWSPGAGATPGIVEQRQGLVPEWARGVQDELRGLGVPYLDVSLLADPSIMRPSDEDGKLSLGLPGAGEPLYGPGARPNSLFSFGSSQAGETSFLRSLTPQEVLRTLGPLDWAVSHRAAGTPVPSGFEAGLTFGSPVWNPGTQNYTRSPVQGLTGGPQQVGAGVLSAQGLTGVSDPFALGRGLGGGLYNRWSAYGYPGEGSSNASGLVSGTRVRRNPVTGKTELYQVSENPFQQGVSQFPDFWAEPNFAPWKTLSDEDRKRMMSLAASPTTPSAML